jgi:hypothetical protein
VFHTDPDFAGRSVGAPDCIPDCIPDCFPVRIPVRIPVDQAANFPEAYSEGRFLDYTQDYSPDSMSLLISSP